MFTRFNDEIANYNAVVVWHPILEQIMNVDIPSNLKENTSEFLTTDGITNDSHMLSTPFSEQILTEDVMRKNNEAHFERLIEITALYNTHLNMLLQEGQMSTKTKERMQKRWVEFNSKVALVMY